MASLAVAAFGCAAGWLAWHLPMGTWDRMGPGFLPACTAGGLVVMALAGLMPRAAPSDGADGSVRPLLIASAGVAGFALLVVPLGGLVAAIMLSTMAGLAAGLGPSRALAHGCVLGAGSLLVFVHGLDVPIPLWPAMAGR